MSAMTEKKAKAWAEVPASDRRDVLNAIASVASYYDDTCEPGMRHAFRLANKALRDAARKAKGK